MISETEEEQYFVEQYNIKIFGNNVLSITPTLHISFVRGQRSRNKEIARGTLVGGRSSRLFAFPVVSCAPFFSPFHLPSLREPLRRRERCFRLSRWQKTTRKTKTVSLGTHLRPYRPKERRTWLLWVWYCCFCTLGRLSPKD